LTFNKRREQGYGRPSTIHAARHRLEKQTDNLVDRLYLQTADGRRKVEFDDNSPIDDVSPGSFREASNVKRKHSNARAGF
jgi:hypothetical protein